MIESHSHPFLPEKQDLHKDSSTTPRIIHLMHFPWDEAQRLLSDDESFDRGPFRNMRAYASDFDVHLWTYSQTREFCRQYYPAIWEALQKCRRPVMMIDILRWVVIHHFGGIYWQMNATPLQEMAAFLPSPGKSVRLFTEFNLSPGQCQAMAAEPIRHGEPEEPTRILIGAFSAQPGAPYVHRTLAFLLDRMNTKIPQRDYDVLYITGNAAVSTAYDRFGKNDPSVELLDLNESRSRIKCHYHGSWRTDLDVNVSPQPGYAASPPTTMDRHPFLAALLYGWTKRHAHETMLSRLDAIRPRASYLPHLAPVIDKLDIHTVCEAPSGIYVPVGGKIQYTGGDPNRAVVAANKRRFRGSGSRFAHVNLLYSRFPQADLFICPDFLEWLSFAEGMRVLRRIAKSRPKYVALTGCPYMHENWDSALGDFRPLNLRLLPFNFPEPMEMIPLPPMAKRRPDRCLMVWPISGVLMP